MLNSSTTEDENPEVAELQDKNKPSSNWAKVLEVELKPLPSSLTYEFLGPKSTYPVIVNANLNATQVDSLLRMLRKYHKAIGYTLDDLKRIHPSLCMH